MNVNPIAIDTFSNLSEFAMMILRETLSSFAILYDDPPLNRSLFSTSIALPLKPNQFIVAK